VAHLVDRVLPADPIQDDEHASNDTPDRTFAGVLARLATQRGRYDLYAPALAYRASAARSAGERREEGAEVRRTA
jgi:hypothetical protein